MCLQVQIFEDNEAEKPSNAIVEPSTWAKLGISHADHAIPSPLRESVEAFVARFDEDVGCSASHFFKFTSSETSIQRFSIPSESAPILEQLRSKHEDFIGQLEVGSGTGNFLLSLLDAIIMDMKSTSISFLKEVCLFEWRGTVRDLIKLGMTVTFLCLHLRYIAKEWFIWTQIVFLKNQISKWKAELTFMLSKRI